MALSQRNGALLLVFVAAVCAELYQAQHVVGRCRCPSFSRPKKINVTDFHVMEKWAGCDTRELILTKINPDNTTTELCMHPRGKIGTHFFEMLGMDKQRQEP